MHILDNSIEFPSVTHANPDGLLALGGDLSVARLLKAYYSGIFPWYDESQPILWFSPDPRMVLFPDRLKVSKSMRQLLRKEYFDVTFSTDFRNVIKNCASIHRSNQTGTWITSTMQKAYIELYKKGYVISTEVWFNEELVGGLYGIWLADKKIFCGESMFSKMSNASKYGFIKLVELLQQKGVKLIDCQVYTAHLASLGAQEISRNRFMEYLK